MKKIQKLKTPHWQMRLKKWSGACDIFQYDREQIDYWKMMISNNGDIYYYTWGEPRRLMIWCSKSQLRSHLFKLYRQCDGDVKKIA